MQLAYGKLNAATSGEATSSNRWRLFAPRGFSYVFCALVALFIWILFYPGIMATDSISQYEQAEWPPILSDWHPPIMSIVLRGVLRCGGDIGSLMLLQCLAGCFGLNAFLLACLRVFASGRLSDAACRYAALALFVLLLAPVAPLLNYFMAFVKDSWVIILLLWVGAVGLHLVEEVTRPDGIRRGRLERSVALFLALATFSLLPRHNTLVLLPVYSLFLFCVLWQVRKPYAVAGLLLPVLLYGLTSLGLKTVFNVRESIVHRYVMANELVGLCVRSDRFLAELPVTNANLIKDRYKQRYEPGNVGFMYAWEPDRIVNKNFCEHPQLEAEYRSAVRRFPLDVLAVKLEAFLNLLKGDDTTWLVGAIDSHYIPKFVLNTQSARLRQNLVRTPQAYVRYQGPPFLKMLLARHPFWLCTTGLFVAGWLAWCLRTRQARPFLCGIVFLLPLGYYCSYSLACGGTDYRFMYPATLMTQGVTLVLITAGGASALSALATRLPGIAQRRRREPERVMLEGKVIKDTPEYSLSTGRVWGE